MTTRLIFNDEQIADGTIATALQAGRTEEVWVQDEENGMPMLKIFLEPTTPTHIVDISATTKSKSSQRYNLMGQPVSRNYKGIVIEDGKKIVVR